MEYPYDLEKELIDNVSDGHVEQSKEIVRKMLNKFSILETGNLEGIKIKALWLFPKLLSKRCSSSIKTLRKKYR